MDTVLSLNKVAIIYNESVFEAKQVAQNIMNSFKNLNIPCEIFKSSLPCADASFVITIGGDGTLLKTARYYAPLDIPLLGINMGRLGFLAQANPDEIDGLLNKLVLGQYKIQSRMMLAADNENEDWECVESTLEEVTWAELDEDGCAGDYEEIPSDEWHPDWR